MTNHTAAPAPTTARAATLAAKRAIRAAGLEVPTIRSRNASEAMEEGASAMVFSGDPAVAAALATIPGATVNTKYAASSNFISVTWS